MRTTMHVMATGLNADGRRRRRQPRLQLELSAAPRKARADRQDASVLRPVPMARNAAEPRTTCPQVCTVMPMSVLAAEVFFWKALLLISIAHNGRRPAPSGAHRNWPYWDWPITMRVGLDTDGASRLPLLVASTDSDPLPTTARPGWTATMPRYQD